MTIRKVYEKYKHLDPVLSDMVWLGETTRASILYDLWQAVKEAATAPTRYHDVEQYHSEGEETP